MPDQRPHILILMPDQHRADSMGCAGHPVVRTPHIDQLAASGVRFSHATTVSPLCMPARASFVSGLYPHNHGIWRNEGELPADDETFFHHLQRAGYYTAYIGKSHLHAHGRGHLRDGEPYMHARGIDYVHEVTGPLATVNTESYMTDRWRELGLLEKYREDYRRRKEASGKAVWPSPLPTEEFLDSYVGREAVEWTGDHDGEAPVCLFVGFGGPHSPWDAPGEYATMYDPADMPPAIPPSDPPDWLPSKAAERMTGGRANPSPDEVAKIRANYYGKISLVDHWCGEILDAFKRRGWLDDTLVVFWSDHGEMAGDHGRFSKSVFDQGSERIPLIIRFPREIPRWRTSRALVESIDVFPTLLEAAGAEPSTRAFGRSLWPILRGDAGEQRDAVFSEVNDITMIRTRQHKYAIDSAGDGFMLHDLEADPEERNNLVGHPDAADVERDLRERMLRWMAATQCRRPYPEFPAE